MPLVELSWNPKQSRFILSESKRLNLEGGVRAGKSWSLCYKVWEWCRRYPGIRIVLSRWMQDHLDAQLKPEWRAMCQRLGTPLLWHGDEEYDELPNGSMVYLRALHTSDDSKRYSKLAGLTIAVLAIDQAEEAEEDVVKHYVPARLSQPGFPHAVWITPNPPSPDHWIASRWPEDGSNPSHELIHTTPYDNEINLGHEYIEDLEIEYPPDSLEYRRLIMGKRGLVVSGQPIYARHFREREHVGLEGDAPVELQPYAPLLAALDFGTLRPACVFGQAPIGGKFHLLGGLMGDKIELEAFVPIVQDYVAEWFPTVNLQTIQWTADPAGQIPNSHGSRTAINILWDFGIAPMVRENANDPRVRAASIETLVGYLKRCTFDGSPVFRLNPRFVVVSATGRKQLPVVQQLLEGGYAYDPKARYTGHLYRGIRKPRKDGYYEHPANCIEYLMTAFAPVDAAEQAGVLRNPDAVKRARRELTSQTGVIRERLTHERQRTGDDRPVTEADVEREIVAILARKDPDVRLQQIRAENERQKAEWKAVRAAQRDPDETFQWHREPALGRGGYHRTRPAAGYFSPRGR
jgi:hypothetical protein